MKQIHFFGITNAVCACVLIVGCAKAPQQEMTAANAALEAAKAAKAPVFSAEQFKAAQEMVNSALADIKAQNAKSPLSRNYEKARKMLVEATASTEAVIAAAVTNKAKITDEAKILLEKAKTSVEESKNMLKVHMKKKNKTAVDLNKKLEAAAASLPADLGKVTDEDLIATRDAIKNTSASVESIKASIEQLSVAKKVAKKKRRK